MTVTLHLDDELVKTAERYTKIANPEDLVNEALRSFIRREVGRYFARLGGTMPDFEVPGRPIYPEP